MSAPQSSTSHRTAFNALLPLALVGFSVAAACDDVGALTDDEKIERREARCLEASSRSACEAVELPADDDLNSDAWQACVWINFHAVETSGDSCGYGAAISECHLAAGGEEDRSDIDRFCSSPDERDNDTVYRLERDGQIYVGYAGALLPALSDLACQYSVRGNGSWPACDCPCLDGFPAPAGN